MIESAYVLTAVLFALVILVQEVLHHRERRELVDRLMAKNLAEYKAEEGPEKPKNDRLYRHREVIKRWRRGGGDG